MRFTIDRSKWRCGDGGTWSRGRGDTLLLNNSGFMCCLGHCSLQVGARKKDIRNYGNPGAVGVSLPWLNIVTDGGTVVTTTAMADEAVNINDDPTIDDKERERRLKELFAAEGHKIVFKGKYHK